MTSRGAISVAFYPMRDRGSPDNFDDLRSLGRVNSNIEFLKNEKVRNASRCYSI